MAVNDDHISDDVYFNFRSKIGNFPGSPVAKTPHSQSGEARLDPW